MKFANNFVNAYLYRVRQRKVKAFQMWVVTRFTTHTRLNDDDDLPLVGCEDYVDVVVLVVDRLLGGSFSPRQKNFRGRTRRLEFTKFWSTFEGKQVVKSHKIWMLTMSWKVVSTILDESWMNWGQSLMTPILGCWLLKQIGQFDVYSSTLIWDNDNDRHSSLIT